MKLELGLIALATGLLTACYPLEEAEPAQIETEYTVDVPAVEAQPTNQPVTKTAEIDWPTAREDFANRPDDDSFGIASGSDAPPVPVLLPEMNVSIASDGPPALQFRETKDGYFAVMRGETYDLIVNGTDKLNTVPGRTPAGIPEDMRYEETLMGSQVAFTRYGASYLVEFACKAENTPVVGSCVTEEEARQAVEDLLIAGTR